MRHLQLVWTLAPTSGLLAGIVFAQYPGGGAATGSGTKATGTAGAGVATADRLPNITFTPTITSSSTSRNRGA